MPRAAVLGSPVGHSLSPVMHRAAYASLGLADWTYDARECTSEQLADVLAEVRDDASWAGLSLTMPLKLEVMALVDEVDDVARRAGSANTVVRRPDGTLWATNTDVVGVAASLEALALPTGLKTAVVLGGGGSARAALIALEQRGISDVRVIMRDVSRGRDLRDVVGCTVSLVPWSSLADEVAAAALVVSSVPSTSKVALDSWPSRCALFDLTYDPWPTPLVALASSAGATTLGGLRMLAVQAAAQVEHMTGRAVDTAVLEAAGSAELDRRAHTTGTG